MVDVSKIKLDDGPGATEVFGDDFVGSFIHHRNFHFTLSVLRADDGEPPKMSRVISARIVMPLDAAIALHQGLSGILSALNAAGEVKRISRGTESVQ
ncbi:MAG: hypothetical protein IH999_04480 [Proteobacteria bacterium]|nr:hypothetical protein [Pseudomonadota bacterium]